MGSFVRWLVDTHGMPAFKEVYAYGDWHGVYGQKPEALIADWERFVDRHSVDESRLEMARFKYSRNSIFKKVCARTIAELRRQARNAESSGDYERAIDLQTDIHGFQKKSPDPGLEIARLLVKLEQWDDATALLDELLARSGKAALKPKTRAKVEELRADILWQADRRADAAQAYERCLGFGHSDSERRLLQLKLLGTTTEDHDEARFAFQYLFESKGRTRALWTARQWTDHAPADPLARYLLGLQLYSAGLSSEAVPYFQGAAGSLALNVLDEQRRVLLARALANTDALDEAHTVWTALLDADSSRVRLLAVEGLDRIRFARDEDLPAHPVAP